MALKFSNIKSLFVTEEETEIEKKESPTSVIKETDAVKKAPVQTKDTSFSWKSTAGSNDKTADAQRPETSLPQGKFSQRIFNSLTKAISDANLPGEDYLEFMEAINAMKDLPLEENIKIKTVFATLSNRGLTPKIVLETGDFYLQVLEKEKEKFYTAFNIQKNAGIAKKKKHISDIEAQNTAKAEQIKKLTDEITQNIQRVEKLNIELSGAENKLKSTEQSFIFTFEKVANQIIENIEKVKTLN